jgi:hypothetical protein
VATQADVDGLIRVVAPSSLNFDIAPNVGPLRQNSIKVIDELFESSVSLPKGGAKRKR